MSTDYPSSNPFRRKGPSTTAPASPPENLPIVNSFVSQPTEPLHAPSELEQADASQKSAKKVRVQSPPPPSPSIPDSSSTIRDDADIRLPDPPTTIPRDDVDDDDNDDDDPFENATSDTSEDDMVSMPMQAPMNPFQKTLETMEHPLREGPSISAAAAGANPGRASMDVDAFKRLLMTGNAGLSSSTTANPSLAHVAHHGLGDGGSSTDASSLSRQSIFEPIQETVPESPRTSHEISEPEDDRRAFTPDFPTSSTVGRKKPAPPSSRHGKLIRVELRDDPTTAAVVIPSAQSAGLSSQHMSSTSLSSNRSLTDLNKPLPPAPQRTSHESDRESIFDKEAAGKTPEPPSPSASIKRKTPPAPPLTRRHSQLVSESKVHRIDSGRLSPKPEEENTSAGVITPGRQRSESVRAPPPPPSRRPGSIKRGSSHQLPLTSPSLIPSPLAPPIRVSAKQSTSGRPLSISNEEFSVNKRSSTVPPPPPRRSGRENIDASPAVSGRTSGEYSRRSGESIRRGSAASSISQMDRVEGAPEGKDILADLSALQREIDALRIRSEKQRVT